MVAKVTAKRLAIALCGCAVAGCSAVAGQPAERAPHASVAELPPALLAEMARSTCGDGDLRPTPGVAESYAGFESVVRPVGATAVGAQP